MSGANEEVHKIIDETRRSTIDAILALHHLDYIVKWFELREK